MALSLGHLASLYNYDMEEYEKAEQLYLRSITIGKSYDAVYTLHRLIAFVRSFFTGSLFAVSNN